MCQAGVFSRLTSVEIIRYIDEEGDCGRVSTPLSGVADPPRKMSMSRAHGDVKPSSAVSGDIWENAKQTSKAKADLQGDDYDPDADAMVVGDLGASKDVLRPMEQLGRKRLVSTSLLQSPVIDSALKDFHQHRLQENVDPFDLKYRLYAVVVSRRSVEMLALRSKPNYSS